MPRRSESPPLLPLPLCVNSLPLGRYFGIQVYVHWTFGLLLFFVAYSGLSRAGGLATGLAAAGENMLLLLAVFFCVLLHEFGHALMARRFGILTHDIILWPLGGLARLEGAKWSPTSELLIAIAGPLVNVGIALVLLCVLLVRHVAEGMPTLDPNQESSLLLKLFAINIGLVLFNMLPAFPMDGGRVLRAIVGYFTTQLVATTIAARIGQGIAVLFIVFAVTSGDFLLIFIGVFVILAGQAELNMVRMMSAGQLPMRPVSPPSPPPAQSPPAAPRSSAGQPPAGEDDPRRDYFSGPRGL